MEEIDHRARTVGVVDAHLLEAVVLEHFEAEDVEQSDATHGLRRVVGAVVEHRDEPVEVSRVELLGERVTSIDSLWDTQRYNTQLRRKDGCSKHS